VIESFVYKTPVIASNSGALPEIIKHKKNGLLFTPNSHEDLVAQVRTILSNPDLSKRLVENALEDAKTNYTSERMITEYIDLYEEVIKKKAACRGLRFRTHPSSKSLI
jgi:glycosyltransferase involved in cell wall biosynthesis